MKMKMADLVAKAVEEARAAKAKGHVVGGGKGADNKDAKAKAADLESRWFKAFAARDLAELKGLNEEIKAAYKAADLSGQNITEDSNGGFLVPVTVESTIIKKLEATSEIRRFATVLNNVVGKLKLGAEDALVQAYWVAETDTATLSEATFATVELQPQKAVGFGKFSDEVLTQTATNPDIRRMVVDQFAAAIQRLEDAAYTNGDGLGKPAGYRTAAGVGSIAQAGASLAGSDLLALYRTVPKAYRANSNWFVADDTAGLLDDLKDTTGRPLLTASYENDVEKLKGKPVGFDPNIPINLGAGTNESEIWFGDFSKYVITDGGGIRVDYGTEGDDFKRSKISVRVIHYTDGALVLPSAVAKLTAVK